MTYRELLDTLQEFCDDELDCPIMAAVDEEYYPVKSVTMHDGHDILSDGHPYLEVE